MKPLRRLLLGLLLPPGLACGFDAGLLHGLRVTVDRMDEAVSVDGVSVSVQRASGEGTATLAQRIENSWRSQGSVIRSLQEGGWAVRSRLHGPHSEVLQWRGKPAHELLWSSLALTTAVQSPPATGLMLPAGCQWNRHISGRSGSQQFMQRTARCNLAPPALSASLRSTLAAQGWQLRSGSELLMLLDRRDESAVLSLAALPGDRATWLTWLRVQEAA